MDSPQVRFGQFWLRSRAARAARLRLTSRTHAASLVPTAVVARDVPALTSLLRHALGK